MLQVWWKIDTSDISFSMEFNFAEAKQEVPECVASANYDEKTGVKGHQNEHKYVSEEQIWKVDNWMHKVIFDSVDYWFLELN